jgi:tetratricopeptide (TPR) repeat protein
MRTAAWVARTSLASVDSGLDTEKALALARDFLAELRADSLDPSEACLDDNAIEVLHAAIEVIASSAAPEDAALALDDIRRLHSFISAASWPESGFGEKQELLNDCSLWAWRLARLADKPSLAQEWAGRLEPGPVSTAEGAHDFRADPSSAPTILLAILGHLRRNWETSPSVIRHDAESIYRYIESPRRPIGLFDDREYFLGEAALIAATCSRFLSLREEADRWLDRAEAAFRQAVNAVADRARVSYQRLALRTEERRFDEVLELLPSLIENFEKLEMPEDAVKCRFIQGLALMEMGEPTEAVAVFRDIARVAQSIHSDRLLASAYVNLTQLHGMLGEADEAIEASRKAIPLLRGLDNRIDIAKTQWGIGVLLRTKGDILGSIQAIREAQSAFRNLEMFADVAALHLLVADMMLEQGQEQIARVEILAALPIIEDYKLVPESVAALELLRESLRKQNVNRQALRDLHGFFEESVS